MRFYIFYIQFSCCFSYYQNKNSTFYRSSRHPIANAWMIDTMIGIAGIFLNSTVLQIIWKERGSIVKSVNVMIGWGKRKRRNLFRIIIIQSFKRMDIFYRILFSITVIWRSLNFFVERNLLFFLGIASEQVEQ